MTITQTALLTFKNSTLKFCQCDVMEKWQQESSNLNLRFTDTVLNCKMESFSQLCVYNQRF